MKVRVLICICIVVTIFCFPAVSETYQVFEENGKVGLKDETGKITIPPRYEKLGWSNRPFSIVNQVIGYRSNGLWGVITVNNIQITEPLFLNINPADGAYLVAYKKPGANKSTVGGCINSAGKEVIPFQYKGLILHSNQAIVYKESLVGDKYGLLDISNKTILPLAFKKIDFVGNMRYAVTDFNNQVALYTASGEKLTDFAFDSISDFHRNHSIVTKNNKYGLINLNGQLVGTLKYSNLVYDENGQFQGREPSRWSLLDGQNKILGRVTADTIVPLGNNLFSVGIGFSQQLTDSQFNPITSLEFDQIHPFIGNKALVKRDGKFGIINSHGTLMIPCAYEEIQLDRTYIFASPQQGKWSLLDSLGNPKTKKTYDRIYKFNGAYFAVKDHNHYGALDHSGNEILSCVYDSIMQYHEDRLVVKFRRDYGIIDKDENWITAPNPYPQAIISSDRYLSKKGNTFYLNSFDGDMIYFTQNEVKSKGIYLMEFLSNGGQWKIDLDGRIYDRELPPEEPFEQIFPASEGLRGIKKNGRYGFVDDEGRLRIANRYEQIQPFQERFAAIMILGKWGFINHDEKIVIQPVFEGTSSFEDGTAIVRQQNRYGLINKTGKLIIPVRYESIDRLPSKRFILKDNGLWGFSDRDGRIIFQPKFEYLTDLNNGYVIVQRNHKYGLLTIEGLSTIPLMYDLLLYDTYNSRYLALEKSQWRTITL